MSAVTAFELAYKVRQGRWPEATELSQRFIETVHEEKHVPLSLSMHHAYRAGQVRIEHRDPFDRMMLAQAEIEGLVFVTADQVLQSLTPQHLW